MARDLDIAVFGATGFLGRLVAEYLAGQAGQDVSIGLAGRSQAKLEALRAEVGGRARDWLLLVADSEDVASLRPAGGASSAGGDYRRALPPPRPAARRSLRGGGHALRRPDRRGPPERGEEPDLGDERDLMGPLHVDELRTWFAPFVMAPINTRVVRRSNALTGWAHGRRFRYREVQDCGPGPACAARAAAITAGLGALVGGLGFAPTRRLLGRLLPQPGAGPSQKSREQGSFRIEFHARSSSGVRFVSTVAASGDPGYKATSVMLGQSALCLAFDELPPRFGVLTPATAMGDALIARLRSAGQTLSVSQAPG